MRSSCDAEAMNCLRARVEPGELALHVVERGRELAQLVVGVGLDRVGEVAGRHLPRGLLEPLDARGERARDEVAADRGEHERERAGGEDAAADQLDVGLHVVERVDEHGDAADAGRLPSPRMSGTAATAWRPTPSARSTSPAARRPHRRASATLLDVGLLDRARLGLGAIAVDGWLRRAPG